MTGQKDRHPEPMAVAGVIRILAAAIIKNLKAMIARG
jgi:hypothetical protein